MRKNQEALRRRRQFLMSKMEKVGETIETIDGIQTKDSVETKDGIETKILSECMYITRKHFQKCHLQSSIFKKKKKKEQKGNK